MNIALIGYGYWGPNIARNIISSPKLNLYAICETNQIRANNAAAAYKTSEIIVSGDYLKILYDPKVDALAIATNTAANYKLAMEAIKAGKHIFIEKPMTATAAQAKDIRDAAEKAGIIVHVDHIMLYNNIIAAIKEMIDNGELGDLLYYDASRMNLGPIRKDVNAMTDLAVHDLALIDYLSNGKEPIVVSAVGETGYGEQETLTYLTMKYEGFIAHLRSSWMSPVKERRVIIGGTKKILVFDDVKSIDKLTIYDSGIEVKTSESYGDYEFKVRTGDIHIPYIPFEDSLLASLEYFADCVKYKTQSRSSPAQAVRVIEILERAQACLNENKDC